MTTGVSVFLKVFGETEAVSIKIFQQFPKKQQKLALLAQSQYAKLKHILFYDHLGI